MIGTTRFYELNSYVKQDCYDEFLPHPIPIREAMLFREILKRMPVEIKPEDFIVGWYGYETMPQEFSEAPDPKPAIAKYIDYSHLSRKEISQHHRLYLQYGLLAEYRSGHTCIRYGDIITKGLGWYKSRIEQELAAAGKGSEKEIYLRAMLISLEASEEYALRLSALARQMADKATDERDRARLLRMYEANKKVPMTPADDFYEAIQAIWTVHTLTPISDNDWYSISMGRLDQFLYPFYERSIAKGETDEDIKNYLKQIFLLLDNYGDGSCAINLGGLSPDGKDQFNKLSQVILAAELESRLRSPLLAVRISQKTPEEVLLQYIDSRLFENGKPAFYNEEVCRAAMMYRNIPEEIAATFTVSSCMALVMAGEETSDMWGCIFNMHLPLELTVNHGRPMHGQLPFELKTRPLERVTNIDDVHKKYGEYFEEILRIMMEISLKTERHHAHNYPNPLLSVLTAGCIEKGCDRMWGAPYRTTIVETFGLVNTANAMTAMDQLVFHNHQYTLDQWLDATRHDFNGAQEILKDIRGCEKFGTNSDAADKNVQRIFNMVERVCKDMYYDNVRYLPSFHTLDVNVPFGEKLYTTMDGRLKGVAVAKNGGPTNDIRSADPTSLMLSSAKLDLYKFTGGNPIDLYFDKKLLRDEETRKKIATLFRTYFDLGGMQIQVNSIDSATLKKAYDKPEDYRQLIVKIGGYSMYFNDMLDAKKLELIERTEYEEGVR